MDGAKSDRQASFAVLGPLEARLGGGPVALGGRRLRALLASLLLTPGRTLPVETLVSAVWEDDPPSGVGNALQALVSRLRACLGRDLVAADATGYRLVISPDQVDAHRFARLAAAGRAQLTRGHPAPAADTLGQALSLWRGAAFADLGGTGPSAVPATGGRDPAAVPSAAPGAEIVRLELLRLVAIEDRVDAELLLGRHPQVAAELPALIAAHPFRERLRGQLMRALYEAGRTVEALAAYEDARRYFAGELGADPSPGLARLHLTILRGEPLPPPSPAPSPVSAPSPSPAPLPVSAAAAPPAGDGAGPSSPDQAGAGEGRRKGDLRARLTSFVGRDKDVRRTGELLARHRLVTMLGPGGAGKTRLAVEAAEALLDGAGESGAGGAAGGGWLDDGVRLVELAPVAEPDDVPQAVLAALGLRDSGRASVRPAGAAPADPVDLTDRIVAGLRARRQLVIMDNCEHLIDAAALLSERILAECPGVRILATSREPLGITGELLWPVQPLDHDHARSLFAERAATARPGYAADRDAEAIERICRELDGMPLAIELAAARLRTLSAKQIADRLDDRFRLLTGGSRTALPRHQTLRAVVEWSWDLLDEREKVLARRFAVFAGGAALEAVETVCSSPGLPPEDVLEVLGRLVDKSLVICENERYRMLETIRAYAAGRLAESGEEEPLRLAHAEFFTGLAETAEPELRRADQVTWLAVLADERDNLTAALRWAAGRGDRDLGPRLVGALGWYWYLAGRRAEGAQRAAEVITVLEAGAPGVGREEGGAGEPAVVLGAEGAAEVVAVLEAGAPGVGREKGGAGEPAVVLGVERAAEVVTVLEAGAPGVGREEDEARKLAVALSVRGILLAAGADQWGEAEEVLNEAMRLAKSSVPRPWPAIMTLAEPLQMFFAGPTPDPEGFLTELFEDPDRWVVACAHLLRAHLHYYNAGRIAEGEADVRTALEHFRAVGDRWGVATAMGALGEMSMLHGDDATTVAVIEEALTLAGEIGAVEDTQYMRTRLATALGALGDWARAEVVLDEALGICRSTGDRMAESGVLAVCGDLARERGEFDIARDHYEHSLRLAGTPPVMPGHYLAMLHSSVGLLAEQEGRLGASREAHAEALRLGRDTVDGPAFGLTLIALAGLVVREGDPARAAALLGAAAGLRGIDKPVGYDHVRITEATTAALPPQEYARWFRHGRSLSRDEIIALADQ
ncbi:AfsR/SARP family transcriptional regulator [Sphaerisporangium fuscum]|uniref:AfsR/SARP family transcriptional regulator n=1 Tax=Sphaerisporangium fuscum TaxID=2835868 RepID=UPI001BDBD0A8|nr:BTAD domain-containing putative transcriptional regulator [Sphaerisporangium fuscum]